MTTYVLVHGAWSGAHGFRHVRAALQGDGHQVFTPSLTGVGERSHPTSPGVGLATQVSDVVNHVLYEDLDAFVPRDGESLFSLTGRATGTTTLGDPWLVPPPDRDVDDPVEAAFMSARRTPQPVGCFSEAVRLAQDLEDYPFTRTYIRATADRDDAPGAAVVDAAAARARASPMWRYREVPTNHVVASNRPEALADLLRELDGHRGP